MQVILNEPIEKWPVCDVLMSWFSKGFPLEKVLSHAEGIARGHEGMRA